MWGRFPSILKTGREKKTIEDRGKSVQDSRFQIPDSTGNSITYSEDIEKGGRCDVMRWD
jgi:hypothetical protein